MTHRNGTGAEFAAPHNHHVPNEYKPRLYLSDIQVAARYSVNRATVWRWASLGTIPKPVKISDGCTRWLAAELDAVDDARARAQGKP